MKDKKFFLGRIKWSSVERVQSALKAAYPRAMSTYKLRISTNINQETLPKILDHLVNNEYIEKVESTEGVVLWKWKGVL